MGCFNWTVLAMGMFFLLRLGLCYVGFAGITLVIISSLNVDGK